MVDMRMYVLQILGQFMFVCALCPTECYITRGNDVVTSYSSGLLYQRN